MVAQGSAWGANALTIQRITTPTSAASWTSARSTITSNATGGAGCALAQTGATIRCFYQSNADKKIYYRDSTNDGVTWGAETAMGIALPLAAGNFCYGLCAPDINTVHSSYGAFDPNGACLSPRSHYSAGAWSAWSNEGPTLPAGWGKVRGLSCVQQGGNTHIAAGVEIKAGITAVSAVTTTTAGGGVGTYDPWGYIQQLDNPALGLTLANPGLFFDGTTYYAAVLLSDDGSLTGTAGQTRLTVFQSSDFATWYPAASFGNVFSYNACVLKIGATIYLFDGRTVYTAPAGPTSTDVSNDVLALDISERISDYSHIKLILSNEAGQYLAHPSVRTDATITISYGYVDAGGVNQLVQTHTCVLESYQYVATQEVMELEINARCKLKMLDHPQTRLLPYSGQTLTQLIQNICAWAQLTVGSLPATPQFSQTLPCFQISPGETWIHALDRLSTVFGFEYRIDASGVLRIREFDPAEASTWSYTTDTILSGTWSFRADQANIIRVIGQGIVNGAPAPVFAEAINSANLADIAAERYAHVIDRELDTAAKCLIRAGLEMRAEVRAATSGQIITLPNPAHERGDIIQLTDPDLGLLTPTSYRIEAIDTQINLDAGSWTQHLHLSGV